MSEDAILDLVNRSLPLVGVVVGLLGKEGLDRFREGRAERKTLLKLVAELISVKTELRGVLGSWKYLTYHKKESDCLAEEDLRELECNSKLLNAAGKRLEALLEKIGDYDPFLVMEVRPLTDSLSECVNPGNLKTNSLNTDGLYEMKCRLVRTESSDKFASRLISKAARVHGLWTSAKVWWQYTFLQFEEGDSSTPEEF